jgi:outer membrane protein TolC
MERKECLRCPLGLKKTPAPDRVCDCLRIRFHAGLTTTPPLIRRLTPALALLLAATVPLHADAPSVDGTLPEDYLPSLKPLLKTAVEHSPSTLLANISVAQQEGNRYIDAQALWPQVSGNVNYTAQTESISGVGNGNSTEKGIFYNFGVTQPVFQWGAFKNNAAIGVLGVKIAQRQYAEAYRLLATQIREQYMYLIVKKIVLRNARFSQKLADEALATQQAKLEAGSVSEADLQTFRISAEQAQLFTDRMAEDFAYAKRVFTRLVGIDDLDDESIPLEVGQPQYSAKLADAVLAGFVADGVGSTFQNEVYRMSVAQQDLSYSIQKVRLLPKLNASASVNLIDQSNTAGGHVYQQALQQEQFQIAANWTIFDGFMTRGLKMEALATKRMYERSRQTYIDSTIDSITYMRHQIGFSARALSLSQVHHALIGAEVKRVGEDLKLGYASPATLEISTSNLYQTDFDLANAQTEYFSRWTEFISLAGIDPAISNIPLRYVR